MNQWLYTVWLRDHDVSKEEQDYEYPACIVIESDSPDKALEWGNKLANNFCSSNSHTEYLKSSVENYENKKVADENVPFIKYGYLASDSEIGW